MAASVDIGPLIRAAAGRLSGYVAVVGEVLEEGARQDAKWGQQNHPDGTGPALVWAFTGPAEHVAEVAKTNVDELAKAGHLTWADILLEEVAEAFAEDDELKLRTELLQVAAGAIQWIRAIDRRRAARLQALRDEHTHADMLGRAHLPGPQL